MNGSEQTSMSDPIAQLRTFPNLADCGDDELAELAEHCDPVTVPAGWAFIVEGMPGDSCFIVLDGEVRVTSMGAEIGRAGPGELVGEIALIEQRPRTATCTAQTAVHLLELDGSEFNGWLQQRPRIRDGLLSTVVERTRPNS
jgi:CRP-like cAMP-binding protein